MPRPFMTLHRPAAGFSLIEVLVALVVFSVGALAIAGLQVRALKAQQLVESRGAAASLLSDFADRLRANPEAALSTNYVYNGTSYAAQRTTMNGASRPSVTKDCGSNTCTAAELATSDLVEWRLALDRLLPAGAGLVQGDSVQGYLVSVAWLDKDWLTATGSLQQTPACTATAPATVAAANAAAMAMRTCCPAALGNPVSAGVRCLNALVRP
jgi:type IV pilus assembly protein PilV